MGKGSTTTVEEVQNRILGTFQSIARKAGNSRDNEFDKLPLRDRIRISLERETERQIKRRNDIMSAKANDTGIRDTWWSRGNEIRLRKEKEERAKL